jgi:hypothetical protein
MVADVPANAAAPLAWLRMFPQVPQPRWQGCGKQLFHSHAILFQADVNERLYLQPTYRTIKHLALK